MKISSKNGRKSDFSRRSKIGFDDFFKRSFYVSFDILTTFLIRCTKTPVFSPPENHGFPVPFFYIKTLPDFPYWVIYIEFSYTFLSIRIFLYKRSPLTSRTESFIYSFPIHFLLGFSYIKVSPPDFPYWVIHIEFSYTFYLLVFSYIKGSPPPTSRTGSFI